MSRLRRPPIARPIFAPGSRIVVRDEEWLVRETKTSALGGTAVRCTGLSELVLNKDRWFLSELDEIRELKPEETELVADRSPHYRQSRLYLESLLRQTPPTDERLYLGHQAAMNVANYQLVPAAQALVQPMPRILIADAVGLGKTVEVGVLLSELIRRGRGRRILVVALKSILSQFQEELWARFTIPLVRLDSVGIQRVQTKIPSNMNPFFYFDRVIISIDTLKKDEKYRRFLNDCRWDAIVIDECQHVAQRSGSSGSQGSQRARLARLLAKTCDALIMTSATPHDGKPESFASLMNLLDPTSVADPSDYTKDEIEGLYVRRFKKDIAHEVESSFQDRELHAQHVEASDAENAVFEALAQATFKTVQPRRRIGTDATTPGTGKGVLFSTLLLKSFLSSPQALASTCAHSLQSKRLADDRLEDPKVAHDRQTLLELQSLAQAVPPKRFTKFSKLVELLDEFGVADPKADNRVVVFSERVQTLEMLEEELPKALKLDASAVAVFHGTLDDQKQQALVKEFQSENSKVRVLLASDAAAEGINLHYYCHRMVHFDMPWSLITLEQRNGRIDRFGQTQTPHIHYLLSVPGNETLKGDLRVLDRLIQKEQAAHQNIGDVASLMNLYDPEAEEERIAEGISHHEAPEDILPDEDEVDFLAELFGEDGEQQTMFDQVETASLESLFASDLEYVREGFAQILEDDESGQVEEPDWQDHLQGLILQAPPDLQRRFDYLPPELRHSNDWEFKLSADRERIQDALARSRQDPDHWPQWQLLWPQHPIVEWLGDRVLASFRRHQAPMLRLLDGVASGEFGFVFQGILSNKRSQPMLVHWFAVLFDPKGKSRVVGLDDLLQAGAFTPSMPNDGTRPDPEPLRARQAEAVELARTHVLGLRSQRGDRYRKTLKDKQRKMKAWKTKALAQLDAQEAKWTQGGRALRRDQKERLERERAHVESLVQRGHDLIRDVLATVDQPYLRIAAALVGRDHPSVRHPEPAKGRSSTTTTTTTTTPTSTKTAKAKKSSKGKKTAKAARSKTTAKSRKK